MLELTVAIAQMRATRAGMGLSLQKGGHLPQSVAHDLGVGVEQEDEVGRVADCELRVRGRCGRSNGEAKQVKRQVVAACVAEILGRGDQVCLGKFSGDEFCAAVVAGIIHHDHVNGQSVSRTPAEAKTLSKQVRSKSRVL